MTRPQVASRSEVARGLRASVRAATPRRGSLLDRRVVFAAVAFASACATAFAALEKDEAEAIRRLLRETPNPQVKVDWENYVNNPTRGPQDSYAYTKDMLEFTKGVTLIGNLPHRHAKELDPTPLCMGLEGSRSYFLGERKTIELMAAAPYIFGSFMESESDRFLYGYLNYYVVSRIFWDRNADVDAILKEHYDLMFGPAASDMQSFFEKLEYKWTHEVVSKTVETALGPQVIRATDTMLWGEIYSPNVMAEYDGLLKEAASKVAPGSIEARRIALFRREFYDNMNAPMKAFQEKQAKVKALVWKASPNPSGALDVSRFLSGVKPSQPVSTRVMAEKTATELVVTVDCDEPRMEDVVAVDRAKDDVEVWKDNDVELILNVSGDRVNYYKFMLNSKGSFTDMKCVKAGLGPALKDVKWDSGAKTVAEMRPGGWRAVFRIPLKALPGCRNSFPADVLRGRTLVGGAEYYMWSPYTKGVDQLENFGTFDFEQPSDARRPRKFSRVWTFTRLRDEEFARKIAALNVQNVEVNTPERLAIAKKYGFHVYACVVGAGGPHQQVMLPEEDAIMERYGMPQPPPGMDKAELRRWTAEQRKARMDRLLSVGYSDGGEPSPGREKCEVMCTRVDCFVGPAARSNSVAKALAALDAKPGADMVLFDYVGYQNYRRCHHPDCERLYREHLAKNNLADTPENEKDFFLGELVAVNNAMHDAIKARNPAIITGAHLYPVFLKEPLYGNRLKFDVIGETCAWYLKWPDEKIRAYAADCTARRPAEYPRSRRVPFIAFTKRGWCEQKTAADIERELNNILDSGADEIMAFEMDAIVNDPEIYGVFLKYCGKDS